LLLAHARRGVSSVYGVPLGPFCVQEPCVVATLRERNSVVFHDNDFEVFIDADASHHNYYELEVP